jgi:excisionase family DNA binding protein
MNQTETQSLGSVVARAKGDNGAAPVPLLYSVPDAARALSIGVSTVWKLIADGKLPTVRIGRSRRIPHEALVRLAGPQQP